MSPTRPTAVEAAELQFPCIKCHATPGEWCSRLGQAGSVKITYLHRERFDTATRHGKLPLP